MWREVYRENSSVNAQGYQPFITNCSTCLILNDFFVNMNNANSVLKRFTGSTVDKLILVHSKAKYFLELVLIFHFLFLIIGIRNVAYSHNKKVHYCIRNSGKNVYLIGLGSKFIAYLGSSNIIFVDSNFVSFVILY